MRPGHGTVATACLVSSESCDSRLGSMYFSIFHEFVENGFAKLMEGIASTDELEAEQLAQNDPQWW